MPKAPSPPRRSSRRNGASWCYREGDIQGSFYLIGQTRQLLPGSVTDRLIRLFSWDVDFQRDIRRGDHFETVYEEVTLEKDESQVKGELVYAGLTLRGKLIDAYLFSPDGGLRTYYDSEGRSLRKFLLRTPIDGARLSSGFGKRKHPVLGYTKMHKGTDFAAPRGTPIYAGGSGRIEKARALWRLWQLHPHPPQRHLEHRLRSHA